MKKKIENMTEEEKKIWKKKIKQIKANLEHLTGV
jgi:hypothetical protein|tara:strand:+ start:1679 stop:1780 length:102 start_codon:yes stop_codon:yes gene_type:complete